VGFQQSVSLDAVHPVGQHESALAPEQALMGTCRQAALHVSAEPVICSIVQGSPSSGQVVGHEAGGSQVSPAPMCPSGQRGAQSLSLVSQPAGQQPSSETQAVIGVWLHVREHASTEPDAWSKVHASPSSQVRAHAPAAPAVMARSQFSLASTTPSPQMTGQSLSLSEVQPGAQQPSPLTHAVMGVTTHVAPQLSARPVSVLVVHLSSDRHVSAVGQPALGP